MCINRIHVENFRTFRKAEIDFIHPDLNFKKDLKLPKPKLANINLLLGNNGFGKTSLLKAIALSALGPAVGDSGIFPYRLVRRRKGSGKLLPALLQADFTTHPQDRSPFPIIESRVEVVPQGDLELLKWRHSDSKSWHPVFSSDSDAFFMVGYGATRRSEKASRYQTGTKSGERAKRVMGLFEEDYALRPLNTWLPEYRANSRLRGRYVQAVHLINRLLGKSNYLFNGEQDKEGEFLFERAGLKVPFPALSDGYRAYVGWIADLLFHVCRTCPPGKKLVENRGIIMVDEIDLHLHPKWQMIVLPALAKNLPNIQFIATTHSPLVVGSLEWMNIIVMQPGPQQSTVPRRLPEPVHGLDADQVLLTDFFGMNSTRTGVKEREMEKLTLQARSGDDRAADKLLRVWSKGLEEVKA